MVTKLGYSTNIFEGARAVLDSPHIGMDLIMCVIGKKISDGMFRAVYEHAFGSDKVIKIEYGHERREEHDCGGKNSFCNVQEFLLWRDIEKLKEEYAWVKKWFAPVHWISPSGHILCMDKTYEKEHLKRPDKIPAFLWDVKQDNFGWIGDRLVCHDYANVDSFVYYANKMKNVKKIWDKPSLT